MVNAIGHRRRRISCFQLPGCLFQAVAVCERLGRLAIMIVELSDEDASQMVRQLSRLKGLTCYPQRFSNHCAGLSRKSLLIALVETACTTP